MSTIPERSPFGGGAGGVQSLIGWDAASTATLTLLPAGHPQGIYEAYVVFVVRTAASNLTVVSLTWASPTFGAENKSFSAGTDFATTGTSFINTNTSTRMHRSVPIMSTGAAPIVLVASNSGFAGVVDIYACARLIAA